MPLQPSQYRILNPAQPDVSRARQCALAVMAKAPRPGKVKTRLSPPLTLDQTADLNICFLRDTTHNIAEVCAAAKTPESEIVILSAAKDLLPALAVACPTQSSPCSYQPLSLGSPLRLALKIDAIGAKSVLSLCLVPHLSALIARPCHPCYAFC